MVGFRVDYSRAGFGVCLSIHKLYGDYDGM